MLNNPVTELLRRLQVRPGVHDQHHEHDGAGLHLPLGLHLAAQHAHHQAGRGVAPVQPLLSLHGHHRQHSTAGTVCLTIAFHFPFMY